MNEKQKIKNKEIKKGGRLEERKTKIGKNFLEWFSDPFNKVFSLVLILAAVLRIIIFQITKNQGLWWDEAGYLAYAKKIAFGWDWTIFWNPHKPVLFSWISALFFKFGLGEISLRIFILLASIAGVWLVYLAIKELFDKKIALLSSFLMAVSWLHLFFTGRLLVELLSSTFFFAALYFFARGYIKKENPKFIWLFGVFFGLMFMIRVSYGVLLIPFVLYVFLEDKLTVFKNKDLWIALLLILLVISPLLIWLKINYPVKPIQTFLGTPDAPVGGQRFAAGQRWEGVKQSFLDVKYVLQWPLLILFVLGFLIYTIDLLIAPDLIFKKENRALRLRFLIISLLILQIAIFGWVRPAIEQRDKIPISPLMFSLVGICIFKIENMIKKYKKIFYVLLIILLFVLAYFQTSWGIQLTKLKSRDGYTVLKEMGLWIKGNSQEGDVIISAALPQMQYYTEREIHTFDAWDYGKDKTEEEAKADMQDYRTKFVEIHDPYSIPEVAPSWVFSYISQNNQTFIPVMAWFSDPGKTKAVAIIYQVVH